MFSAYDEGGTANIIDTFFPGIESDNFTIEGKFIDPDGIIDVFSQIQIQNPVNQLVETFQIIEIARAVEQMYQFKAHKIG